MPLSLGVIVCVVTMSYLLCASTTTGSELAHKMLVNAPNTACLDGSAPGGYLRRNVHSTSWIFHMEGGGWCWSEEDCLERSKSTLGSSSAWPDILPATMTSNPMCCSSGGILSGNKTENPLFFDYNMFFVGYCDGSSYSSNAGLQNGLHYRGWNNLKAVLDMVMDEGMEQADTIIITGCSAGGLSVYLHLDALHAHIAQRNPHAVVVGVADAGFFLNVPTWNGVNVYPNQIAGGYKLWQFAHESLPAACLDQHAAAPWNCLFAPEVFPFIKTPLFAVQALYDTWQLYNIYDLPCTPMAIPHSSLPVCNQTMMNVFHHYRDLTEAHLKKADLHSKFAPACANHCQTIGNYPSPMLATRIQGLELAEAIDQWMRGADSDYEDTCQWPCNPTCQGLQSVTVTVTAAEV